MKVSILLLLALAAHVTTADLSTYKLGNTTYTTGTINGRQVNTSSYKLGDTTYTTGNVGDYRIGTSTYRLGNTTYTSGRAGDSRVNTSSYNLGGTRYTSGTIGGDQVHASSYKLGGTTYTSGSVGNTQFRSSSYKLGNTAYQSVSCDSMPIKSKSGCSAMTKSLDFDTTASTSNYRSGFDSNMVNDSDVYVGKGRRQNSYQAPTAQSTQNVSVGSQSVLDTNVRSVVVTRNRIELSSGDTIKFLDSSKKAVRKWRNGDRIRIYEIKSGGVLVGYKLVNVDHNSVAVGVIE